MTYNEYAQLLEAENPDTGELYTADDFTAINWNDEGTAMLQDAIWANSEKLASDEEYQATDGEVHQGEPQGLDLRARQPGGGAGHRRGPGLAAGQQPPAVADERDQQADLAVAGRHRHDRRGRRGTRPSTSPCTTKNDQGATVITTEPDDDAYTNEYVEKALAELKDEGVDVTGEDFEPIDVTLEAGGK